MCDTSRRRLRARGSREAVVFSREALGISQEDLAHEAGMDRSHLGAIERGKGVLFPTPRRPKTN
jgi:transcriptional regulator with XRE-family HTH domain